MENIASQLTDLVGDVQTEALAAARAVEDPTKRFNAIGFVAMQTKPAEAALPLWIEAADIARGFEDPNERAASLASLLPGIRGSVKK